MVTRGLDFLKDAAATAAAVVLDVSTASYFPGVVMQVFTSENKKYLSFAR